MCVSSSYTLLYDVCLHKLIQINAELQRYQHTSLLNSTPYISTCFQTLYKKSKEKSDFTAQIKPGGSISSEKKRSIESKEDEIPKKKMRLPVRTQLFVV